MGKPDEQIKIVMKRGNDSLSLVDLFREGNEYHATTSGSDTKHTYHASGRVHVSSIRKGTKEYSNIRYSAPPASIKGFVQLVNLSISPDSEWHGDRRFFKRYYGKQVTMVEVIDVAALTPDEQIVIVAGLAESRAHATRAAIKIAAKEGLNRPIIKKLLSRDAGPLMVVLVYFKKRLENQQGTTAMSVMGSTLTLSDPLGGFGPEPKPHKLIRNPGMLLFPVDADMPRAIRTIWKERHDQKNGSVFDFEIRNFQTANFLDFLAIIALLPKHSAHLVTYSHIARHILSDRQIPLPAPGEVLAVDFGFSRHHSQEFNVDGTWYRLTLLRNTIKRRKLVKNSEQRSYFIIEFIKLTPNLSFHYHAPIEHSTIVTIKKTPHPIQSYMEQSEFVTNWKQKETNYTPFFSKEPS